MPIFGERGSGFVAFGATAGPQALRTYSVVRGTRLLPRGLPGEIRHGASLADTQRLPQPILNGLSLSGRSPVSVELGTGRQETGLAYDFASIVQRFRIQQMQCGVGGYQCVEVSDYLVFPYEGGGTTSIDRKAHHFVLIVDGVAATGDGCEGSGQSSQILHPR